MNKPTDSVRIALFNSENPQEVLVLSEADDPTNFKLPGGKFESETETPDEAAWRELNEELGIAAGSVELIQAEQLVNNDGVSARYIYGALIKVGQIEPSEEIYTVMWPTEDSLPDSPNKSHMQTAIHAARKVL